MSVEGSRGLEYTNVLIHTGCGRECAFCSKYYKQGRFTAFMDKEIIDACTAATKFIGKNISAYCYDEMRLSDLVKKVIQTDKVQSLAIGDSNIGISPYYKDSFEIVNLVNKEPKIVKRICITAQSLSNKILQRMNLGYTKEDVFALLSCIDKNVAITLHLIIGFPGETEKEFEETLSYVKDKSIDIRCSGYFYRYGSKEFSDTIPIKIITERIERIKRIRKKQEPFKSSVVFFNYSLDNESTHVLTKEFINRIINQEVKSVRNILMYRVLNEKISIVTFIRFLLTLHIFYKMPKDTLLSIFTSFVGSNSYLKLPDFLDSPLTYVDVLLKLIEVGEIS
jgi:tRNA A37 methylthiotransferase MiaB